VVTYSTNTARTLAVLAIDDEDYIADLIAATLTFEGYDVSVAYNGRDGLAQAQAQHFDLIIVDIMMPYLGGISLIEHLRQQEMRAVPIIMISAGARPPESFSDITFLAKPFSIDWLLRQVADHIGKPERAPDPA
jgi:DNA-binding response OmpR family regulator